MAWKASRAHSCTLANQKSYSITLMIGFTFLTTLQARSRPCGAQTGAAPQDPLAQCSQNWAQKKRLYLSSPLLCSSARAVRCAARSADRGHSIFSLAKTPPRAVSKCRKIGVPAKPGQKQRRREDCDGARARTGLQRRTPTKTQAALLLVCSKRRSGQRSGNFNLLIARRVRYAKPVRLVQPAS